MTARSGRSSARPLPRSSTVTSESRSSLWRLPADRSSHSFRGVITNSISSDIAKLQSIIGRHADKGEAFDLGVRPAMLLSRSELIHRAQALFFAFTLRYVLTNLDPLSDQLRLPARSRPWLSLKTSARCPSTRMHQSRLRRLSTMRKDRWPVASTSERFCHHHSSQHSPSLSQPLLANHRAIQQRGTQDEGRCEDPRRLCVRHHQAARGTGTRQLHGRQKGRRVDGSPQLVHGAQG